MRDHQVFELGDVTLQSGVTLPDAQLAYRTVGKLNAAGDNAVLVPSYYTGTHRSYAPYYGPGRALDPERHFIILTNLFGNGVSSSPSNTAAPFDGPRFPLVSVYDNVAFQRRLLSEELGVERLALVVGWSMGAMQAFQWASQYPDRVAAILPIAGSAKCSPHNYVFLDGVRAALEADGLWNDGDFTAQPEAGLKAFARVYAGWAFSQTFYREGLYRKLGFETIEDLLVDWENDHLGWNGNDLLAKLRTWQAGDISANALYQGDFQRALGAITARAIVMPCRTDLYFPPEDSEIEVAGMPNAELRVIESPFGHCVASPGAHADFTEALDPGRRRAPERKLSRPCPISARSSSWALVRAAAISPRPWPRAAGGSWPTMRPSTGRVRRTGSGAGRPSWASSCSPSSAPGAARSISSAPWCLGPWPSRRRRRSRPGSLPARSSPISTPSPPT